MATACRRGSCGRTVRTRDDSVLGVDVIVSAFPVGVGDQQPLDPCRMAASLTASPVLILASWSRPSPSPHSRRRDGRRRSGLVYVDPGAVSVASRVDFSQRERAPRRRARTQGAIWFDVLHEGLLTPFDRLAIHHFCPLGPSKKGVTQVRHRPDSSAARGLTRCRFSPTRFGRGSALRRSL